MDKPSFEQIGGTYHQAGDYLIPNLDLPQNEKPIGVWGRRHHAYLRNTNRVLLSGMILSGKLNDYLADIDRQAEEMFSRLVKQLAEKEEITETLKASNQMEWVRKMNTVRAQATEIVNSELIYT